MVSTCFTKTSVLPILAYYSHTLKHLTEAVVLGAFQKMVVGDTPAAATQLSAPKTQPLHSGMDFMLILDAVSIIQEINPDDLQPLGRKKKRKKQKKTKKKQNQLPSFSEELVTVLSSKQGQAHVPQFTSGFPFG